MLKGRKKTKQTVKPAILAITGVFGFGYLVTLTTGFIDDYHRQQGLERIQVDEQRLVRFVLEHHLAGGSPAHGLSLPVADDQEAAVAVDLGYRFAGLPAETVPSAAASLPAPTDASPDRVAQPGSGAAPVRDDTAQVPLPPEAPTLDTASLPPEPSPATALAQVSGAPVPEASPLEPTRSEEAEASNRAEPSETAAIAQLPPADQSYRTAALAPPTEASPEPIAPAPDPEPSATDDSPPAAGPVSAPQVPARTAAVAPPEADARASMRAPAPTLRLLPPTRPLRQQASIDPGALADRPDPGPTRALPNRREPGTPARVRAPRPAEKRTASLPSGRASEESQPATARAPRRSTAALDTAARPELPRSLRPRPSAEPAPSFGPTTISLPASLRPTRIQPSDVVALRPSGLAERLP